MRHRVVLAFLLLGCGAKSEIRLDSPQTTSFDAARDIDASIDAAVADAPTPDALAQDAFAQDAPSIDAFTPDAITLDAFTPDAFVVRDTGLDAFSPDAVVVPTGIGCSDGEREAFRDRARYPRIAGCGGGWTRPGIVHPAPLTCDGRGGDDGPFPNGGTCGVADLCEVGWHVCTGPSDVAASSPDGCAGAHDAAESFFATRMSSSGCGVCATGTATDCTAVDCRSDCAQTASTTNDVFGCGTMGLPPDPRTCGPLDAFGDDQCGALSSPWSCTDDGSGTHEAELLTKRGAGRGGVLCCRD